MGDLTTDFFTELGCRGHNRIFADFTGTIRLDIVDDEPTDSWFLAISNGDVRVSRECRDADCVVRGDRALFNRIISGEANAWAAWLSNRFTVDGPLLLFRLLMRTFPGPRGARHPRSVVPAGGGGHG